MSPGPLWRGPAYVPDWVNSSNESPVMNVKYAGINGRMHGEKKESRPATNAAG
jgi:hypothetical protein